MLKENWRFISRLERVIDLMIVILSFFAAYYFRGALFFWGEKFGFELRETPLAPIKDYTLVLTIGIVGYGVFLSLFGAYNSMRINNLFRLIGTMFSTSFTVFVLLSTLLYLLKLDLSRSFIIMFCFLNGSLLTIERYLVLEFLRVWRKRGRNFRNIIMAGTGVQAVKLAHEIISRPELGLRIRAFTSLSSLSSFQKKKFRELLKKEGFTQPARILEGVEALEKAIRHYVIDEVLFTDATKVMQEVEKAVEICAEQGVQCTLAADFFSYGLIRSRISYFADMPLIHFQPPPGDSWELVVKRIIDVIVSAVLLVSLSPLFFLIAVAIKTTSRGPVLFKQKRVGKNGRIFTFYKFRSMIVDAEKQLEKVKSKNEMKGPVFKSSSDPRVTKIGRFLRKYSLDELPQLWNVLIGDMSLVGPRPPVPGEVSMYNRGDRRRLSMRPGMTCIWQVSGRNNINDFSEWVKLDLHYIDNWSLWLDLILLLKTVPAVLSGKGAH